MELDKNTKLPLYKQIFAILTDEIKSGLYEERGVLPSEHSLSDRFDVERATVRKALQMLVDDGLVKKMPGYGTKIVAGEAEAAPFSGEITAHSKSIMLISQEDYLRTSNGEYFHYRLIHGFERQLSAMGFDLLIKSAGADGSLSGAVLQTAPAAVIFDSYVPEEHYREALETGIPCISVNHYTPLMTSVVSNNFDGAYQVTRMLAEAGHQRIAFITGKWNYQTSVERLSGVQRSYIARGEALDEKYIIHGNYSFDSGYQAGEKILSMPEDERPTAVFAFNDDMAFGCYSCFERHGVKVPGEISIVGFDRSDRFSSAFGPITTVDVNIDAMISYTCWYLRGRLNGTAPDVCAKIQIDTSIIDGRTTRRI